jgi:hypothetical protein
VEKNANLFGQGFSFLDLEWVPHLAKDAALPIYCTFCYVPTQKPIPILSILNGKKMVK